MNHQNILHLPSLNSMKASLESMLDQDKRRAWMLYNCDQMEHFLLHSNPKPLIYNTNEFPLLTLEGYSSDSDTVQDDLTIEPWILDISPSTGPKITSVRCTNKKDEEAGSEVLSDSRNSDTSSKKRRRSIRFQTLKDSDIKPRAYDPRITSELMAAFDQSPYPGRTEREKLAVKLGLTHRQVLSWFNNRRNRKRNGSGSQ